MSPKFAIQYNGAQSTSSNFACPRAAVAWALKRGLRDFSVIRVSGPAGFYSAYRTYAGGRMTADNQAARQGCGRGRGYGPGVRRVA